MVEIGYLSLKLGADVAEFIKNLDKGVKKMEETEEKILHSVEHMADAFSEKLTERVAEFFAFKELKENIEKFIDKNKEAEVASARLAGVLRATGEAAGVTGEAADDLAEKYSKLLGVKEDVIKESEAMILTFDKIKSDTFPQVTKAALDISAAMGIDLKSAAIGAARAMQDPEKAGRALRGMHIQLNAAQTQYIKNLQDAGQFEKAQAALLDDIKGKVGGVADIMRDTLDGALKAADASWTRLNEHVGDLGSMHALRMGVESMIEIFDKWDEELKKSSTKTYFDDLGKSFQSFIDGPVKPFINMIAAIGDHLAKIAKYSIEIQTTGTAALGAFLGGNTPLRKKLANQEAGMIGDAFNPKGGIFDVNHDYLADAEKNNAAMEKKLDAMRAKARQAKLNIANGEDSGVDETKDNKKLADMINSLESQLSLKKAILANDQQAQITAEATEKVGKLFEKDSKAHAAAVARVTAEMEKLKAVQQQIEVKNVVKSLDDELQKKTAILNLDKDRQLQLEAEEKIAKIFPEHTQAYFDALDKVKTKLEEIAKVQSAIKRDDILRNLKDETDQAQAKAEKDNNWLLDQEVDKRTRDKDLTPSDRNELRKVERAGLINVSSNEGTTSKNDTLKQLDDELKKKQDLAAVNGPALIQLEAEEKLRGLFPHDTQAYADALKEVETQLAANHAYDSSEEWQKKVDAMKEANKVLDAKFKGTEKEFDLQKQLNDLDKDPYLTPERHKEVAASIAAEAAEQDKLNEKIKEQQEVLAKVFNGADPAIDSYKDKLELLDDAYKKQLLTIKQYDDALQKLNNSTLKSVGKGVEQFTDKLLEGITNAITSGKKLGDILKDIEKQLLKAGVKKFLISPISQAAGNAAQNFFKNNVLPGAGGNAQGGGGLLGSLIRKIFLPGGGLPSVPQPALPPINGPAPGVAGAILNGTGGLFPGVSAAPAGTSEVGAASTLYGDIDTLNKGFLSVITTTPEGPAVLVKFAEIATEHPAGPLPKPQKLNGDAPGDPVLELLRSIVGESSGGPAWRVIEPDCPCPSGAPGSAVPLPQHAASATAASAKALTSGLDLNKLMPLFLGPLLGTLLGNAFKGPDIKVPHPKFPHFPKHPDPTKIPGTSANTAIANILTLAFDPNKNAFRITDPDCPCGPMGGKGGKGSAGSPAPGGGFSSGPAGTAPSPHPARPFVPMSPLSDSSFGGNPFAPLQGLLNGSGTLGGGNQTGNPLTLQAGVSGFGPAPGMSSGGFSAAGTVNGKLLTPVNAPHAAPASSAYAQMGNQYLSSNDTNMALTEMQQNANRNNLALLNAGAITQGNYLNQQGAWQNAILTQQAQGYRASSNWLAGGGGNFSFGGGGGALPQSVSIGGDSPAPGPNTNGHSFNPFTGVQGSPFANSSATADNSLWERLGYESFGRSSGPGMWEAMDPSVVSGSIIGGGTGSTGTDGAVANIFSSDDVPGYALGGQPEVGKPAWVGEQGKELFVPHEPGTVVSNDKIRSLMSSGNGQPNVQIINNGHPLEHHGTEFDGHTMRTLVDSVATQLPNHKGYQKALQQNTRVKNVLHRRG